MGVRVVERAPQMMGHGRGHDLQHRETKTVLTGRQGGCGLKARTNRQRPQGGLAACQIIKLQTRRANPLPPRHLGCNRPQPILGGAWLP